MRKIIIILLVCLVVPICFAEQGYWEKTTCEICGKQIYVWVEKSIWDDGIYGYADICFPGDYRHMTVSAEKMEYGASMQVCDSCYNKYNMVFKKAMTDFFNDWKCKILELNKSLREKNQKENKEKKIKEIKNKIKELKEELKKEEK